MIKETLEFTDYNGVNHKETYYFALNKAELVRMNFALEGGFTGLVEKIQNSSDMREIYPIFEDLIMKSYCVKTPDGKKLHKSPEVLEDFMESPAYETLIMKILSDADYASNFTKGILPADVVANAESTEVAPMA